MIDLTQATESWQLASRRTTTAATCAFDWMTPLLTECKRLTAENEELKRTIRDACDEDIATLNDLGVNLGQPDPERVIWWPDVNHRGIYIWPDGSHVYQAISDLWVASTGSYKMSYSHPTREAAAAWLFDQHCGPWHPRPKDGV